MSPPDVYLTSTFGYSSVKPSITAWNDSCSSPAQIAMTEIDAGDVLAALGAAATAVVAAATCGGERQRADERAPATTHRYLIPSSFPGLLVASHVYS